MYKKVNDPKSELILPSLSFVEVLEPDICYFENVRGFLNSALNAIQVGPHKIEGGIQMGLLKFLIHALKALG